MQNEINLYCKLFVDSVASRDALTQIVAKLLHSNTEALFSTYVPGINISVWRNKDFDEKLRKDFPAGFLHFAYIVDIDTAEEQQLDINVPKERQLEKLIILISKILQFLWSQGIATVAACDYEDRLPNKGGYNSKDVPWVRF